MNGELKEHFKTRPEYWTFSYCSPEITALGDPNGGTRHRAVRWSLPPHRDVLEEECNMPEVKPSSFDCVFPMLPLAVWSQHLHLAAHLAALTSFPKSSLPLRSPSQGGTITAAGCPKCPGLASFYRTFPCCQWAFRLASQSSSTQNQNWGLCFGASGSMGTPGMMLGILRCTYPTATGDPAPYQHCSYARRW